MNGYLPKAILGKGFEPTTLRCWKLVISLSVNEKGLFYQLYGGVVKLMLVLLLCCETVYGLVENLTMEERIQYINTILIQLLTAYRYKNMIDNKTMYKTLATSMESPHFDGSTHKRKMIIHFWAKKNEQYLKLLIGLGNCTLLAWYIFPLIDDIEFNLCIGTYVPFAYNTPVRYAIAYVSVGIAFAYIAEFVMLNDVTMQAYLIHIICQLSVLGDCFENLLQDCQVGFEGTRQNYLIYNKEFADKYVRRMGNLVEQHKLILSHTMNLRITLSKPMLCQFMISGTLICFVGFQTLLTLTRSVSSVAKTVNSVLYLGYNLFELYIICRWCDEIRVQSLNIGEAIYSCGWESGASLLPGIKQTVKFVIARANEPLTFTAGGMYDLTLASFSYLVKTSYSALTVVLRMSQHK